jgi:AraC-like DNA-binding protein
MAIAAFSASAPAVWRHLASAPPREDWRTVMDRLCLPYVEPAAAGAAPQGDVLWKVSESGAEFTRLASSPQRIAGRYPRQSKGVWVSALTHGEAELEVEGRRVSIRPGALLFGPTGAPASVDYRTPFRQLFVKLPRAAVHPRLAQPTGLGVGHIDAGTGSARLLFSLMSAAADALDDLSPDDLRPLEMAVTEFLVSCLAQRPGASTPSLLSRIRQTVEARLSEATLDIEQVAAAHRISPRYLQKLFKAADDTFGRYLLERRLERCRAELASALHAKASISEICFRWGFNGSAHFSRVFRDRFDASPREYRRRALAG